MKTIKIGKIYNSDVLNTLRPDIIQANKECFSRFKNSRTIFKGAQQQFYCKSAYGQVVLVTTYMF